MSELKLRDYQENILNELRLRLTLLLGHARQQETRTAQHLAGRSLVAQEATDPPNL